MNIEQIGDNASYIRRRVKAIQAKPSHLLSQKDIDEMVELNKLCTKTLAASLPYLFGIPTLAAAIVGLLYWSIT